MSDKPWKTLLGLALCVSAGLASVSAQPLPVQWVVNSPTIWGVAVTRAADRHVLFSYEQCVPPYRHPTSEEASSMLSGCSFYLRKEGDASARRIVGPGAYYGFAWSPDGRKAAFYKLATGYEGTVWIWNSATGKAIIVPHLSVQSVLDVISWSPDSRYIYVRAATKKPENAATHSSSRLATVFTYDPNSHADSSPDQFAFDGGWFGNLARIDVRTGATKVLARNLMVLLPVLSPDGTKIAFTSTATQQDRTRAFKPLTSIRLIDTRTGASRILADALPSFDNNDLQWSPDSRHLAFTVSYRQDFRVFNAGSGATEFSTTLSSDIAGETWCYNSLAWTETGKTLLICSVHGLWKYDPDTKQLSRILSLPDQHVYYLVTVGIGPTNSLHVTGLGSGVAWTPDHGTSFAATVSSQETGDHSLVLFNPRTGEARYRLLSRAVFQGQFCCAPIALDDGGPLYSIYQNPTTPQELVRIDPQLSSVTPLFQFQPVPAGVTFGNVSMISWKGAHGETVQGALLLPSGYVAGRRYPLLIFGYPAAFAINHADLFGLGPSGEATWDEQFFATRGYAVLMPDMPLQSRRISEIAGNFERAADAAVAAGIASPGHIGVLGHSQGATLALAAIEGTNRFAAAIAVNPVYTALTALVLKVSPGGDAPGDGLGPVFGFGGRFWQPDTKNVMLENDPALHTDASSTPLLLVRGELDPVESMATDEIYAGYVQQRKEIQFVRYPTAGHVLSVDPLVFEDFLNREIRWLDEHLKR